jgi:hypothetical protein
MARKLATSLQKDHDAKTDKVLVVRGFGALKDSPLALDPSIDLTKPIAAQVLVEKHNPKD